MIHELGSISSSNRKELHQPAEKKRSLKAEREQKKGNYQQRKHCFRQGHPSKRKWKGFISRILPCAAQEIPGLLAKGRIPGED